MSNIVLLNLLCQANFNLKNYGVYRIITRNFLTLLNVIFTFFKLNIISLCMSITLLSNTGSQHLALNGITPFGMDGAILDQDQIYNFSTKALTPKSQGVYQLSGNLLITNTFHDTSCLYKVRIIYLITKTSTAAPETHSMYFYGYSNVTCDFTTLINFDGDKKNITFAAEVILMSGKKEYSTYLSHSKLSLTSL